MAATSSGPITLTRTFAIHIWVLPFLLFAFIGGHLYLLRRHGEFGAWVNYDTSTGNPSREIAERIRAAEPPYPTKRIERRYAAPNKTVDFFPNQLFKDTLVSAALILFIFIMGGIGGAPLDTFANPATLTYVPTPEWFYLPLDQFLVLTPQDPLIAIGVLDYRRRRCRGDVPAARARSVTGAQTHAPTRDPRAGDLRHLRGDLSGDTRRESPVRPMNPRP